MSLPRSGPGAGRKKRLILSAWFLVILVSCIAYGIRPGIEDLSGYVASGNAVLSKLDIYQGTPPGVNTWPPFFSLVCVPLALLDRISPYLTATVWVLLLWVAIFVTFDLLGKLVYKKKFTVSSNPLTLSLGSPEILVPFLLAFPYVISNFEHLQCGILLFALALGGLYLQSSQREEWGGVALGAAAAMKVMAFLFVPYLFYRRRWRAAIWAAASAAGFSLSPALVFGWRHFWQDCLLWFQVIHRGWGPGSTNQSPLAMWDRILGYGFVPFMHPGIAILSSSGAQIVEVAWAGTLIAVLLCVALVFRGDSAPGSSREQAEWSIVFILSVLLAPVLWKHYLVVLLLPYALLYAASLSPQFQGQRRGLRAILWGSFLLSLPTLHSVIGNRLAARLEMGSVVTYGVFLMLGGLLWFCVQAHEARSPQAALPVGTLAD